VHRDAVVRTVGLEYLVVCDGNGVSVRVGGRLYATDLQLLDYAPDADWRFSIGATAGQRGSAHRVDNVRVRSGELLEAGVVPLSVSVNGQETAVVPRGFAYATPPVLSSVSPAAGPVAGGTRLLVHGFGVTLGEQLECALQGAVVPAARVNDSAVTCESPAADYYDVLRARAGVNESGALTAAAAEPLELSRNGQRFTQQALFDQRADVHGLRLRLYAPPNVTRLAPATGPLGGGTQVSVDGHGHAAGVDYRCRFGNATVPATFDEHAGLGCTAPAWSAAQVCARPLSPSR
jgi:hypothetical protein